MYNYDLVSFAPVNIYDIYLLDDAVMNHGQFCEMSSQLCRKVLKDILDLCFGPQNCVILTKILVSDIRYIHV